MSDLSLSAHYFPVTVTTPAGTLRGSPQQTAVQVGSTLLTEVNVLMPAGHAGQTGFALQYSGQVIVPFGGTDSWIRGNDEDAQFEVSFPVGSGLLIVTYNEGRFDHSHYVRLRVDDNAYRQAGQGGIAVPVIG